MQKIGFCDKFSLTQAVLNGTKTMTRRLEKALEHFVSEYEMRYEEPLRVVEQRWDENKNRLLIYAHTGIADTDREHVLTLNTRYKVGEVVAVAQSYSTILKELEDPRNFDCMEHWEAASAKRAHYAELVDFPGWNNKLFVSPSEMIHQIQIMDVSIEKLQAISDDDCLKEGVICETFDDGTPLCYKVLGIYDKPTSLLLKEFITPREAFATLINRPGVGRKGLWESNPFVVVYEFKLIK